MISDLLILFIFSKLTNIIDWSWFWVLSPAWIGIPLKISLEWVLKQLKEVEQDKKD